MADLTHEQALARVVELEAESTNLHTEITNLKANSEESKRELSSLNDKIRANEAAQTTLQETIARQTETLKDFDTKSTELTSLQEKHTILETQYTGSLHSRLKGHGLAEDKFKSRGVIELEAMITALDGIPNQTTNPGNPPANPSQAGVGGSGSSNIPGADNRGVIGDGGIADELKIIENARNRNST
jgi:hypothetical protein